MKTMMKLCIGIVACASSLAASAGDNACLIQGEFTEDGMHEVINNCISNKGLGDQDFKTACQDWLDAYRSKLSKKSANKITMKSGSSCPTGYKAACEGAFGLKMNLLYMGSDSSFAKGDARLLCESGDGKWRR